MNNWFDPDKELCRQEASGELRTFKSTRPPVLSEGERAIAESIRTFGKVIVQRNEYNTFNRLFEAGKINLSEEITDRDIPYKIATYKDYKDEANT